MPTCLYLITLCSFLLLESCKNSSSGSNKAAMTSNKNNLKSKALGSVYAYSYMVNTFICVFGELKSFLVPMTQCYNPQYRLIMSGKHNKPGQKSLWREI